MQTRNAYILGETLISIAINTVLSIGFVFLAFHGQAVVPMTGRHGIALDMAPQTFMVILMSFLVPSLLTRKRFAAGALQWCAPPSRPRFNAFLWAIPTAAIATCLVVALSWFVLPALFPSGVAYGPLLAAKALFGAVLAALVTPWAIRTALR